ncbi:hypothetical protein Daus18300_005069 [Diaporthe australafricana]|uniref:Uncharacterized protein n=1 Tax=Diaporthe australafricana TaxID=127596 RepID=A0ABR3X4S9_9PEZI
MSKDAREQEARDGDAGRQNDERYSPDPYSINGPIVPTIWRSRHRLADNAEIRAQAYMPTARTRPLPAAPRRAVVRDGSPNEPPPPPYTPPPRYNTHELCASCAARSGQ